MMLANRLMALLFCALTALQLSAQDHHEGPTLKPLDEAPCPEFDNNHYMRWIDLDASCATRQAFIARVASEGLWSILDEGDESLTVVLTKKDKPFETVKVLFANIEANMAANFLSVETSVNCEQALKTLEQQGLPPFPPEFYNLGRLMQLYMPLQIGDTAFMISGTNLPHTCEWVEYFQL